MTAPPRSSARRTPRAADEARAHAVGDGVWALQLPVCYESVASVNAYLLASPAGWIMVDCGSCLPPGWSAVAVALERAGVAPRDVQMLVVTHAHCDHRGLASEVVAQTGCSLATGPAPHPIIDVLRDPRIPIETRRSRARREGVAPVALDVMVDELPGGEREYPRAEAQIVLAPGDVLAGQHDEWRVLAAPGHSADQIVLWSARRRWLIGADLALPGPASFLEYGTRPDPHADQIGSLDRVLEVAPDLLLAGHGRPIEHATAFLERCRERVGARPARIRAATGADPRSAWDLVVGSVPATAPADRYQAALSSTLCVLEHLESRGCVRSLTGDDGVRRWVASGPGGRARPAGSAPERP
jgi:glyoxylase-like metal-dependent hydrolase (beta-lactamase superfamily II)